MSAISLKSFWWSHRSRIASAFGMVLLMVLLFFPNAARAQLATEPQAESPEEYDAYLAVLATSTPRGVIDAVQEFERKWPRSAMSAHIYEMEMEAYRSLNDPVAAIRAGERALRAAPDNVADLAQLAYLIADTSSEANQLSRAEGLARAEFESAQNLHLPRTFPPDRADQIQRKWASMAHSALGLVNYKRGNFEQAILEFEAAEDLSPSPDPALQYRLGSLYRVSGNVPKAIDEFEKAENSNDPVVVELAKARLKELRRSATKKP